MQGRSLWALPVLILLAVDVSIQDHVPLDCQPGWTLMGVQCYKLYQGILPWESAAKVCKSYGAELAKVTDFTENEEVGMFAGGQNTHKFWIGFSRYLITGFTRTEAPPGNQVIAYFSDGEETTIAAGFWENGQPNDEDGKCVYLMQRNNRYYWTFGPCEMKLPYVCQRPACPDGSYHCVNGRCINPNLVCDGEDDCGDSSDENNCADRCTYMMENSAGSITSLNFPNNYPDARNCLWVIKVPLGQNAYIRFTNLTTAMGDNIQVLVGGLTEDRAQLVGTHSGDLTMNLPEYVSQNNMLIVKFSSDSMINMLGFRAEYNGRSANLPIVKNLMATNDVASLFSPNYPQHYLGCQDYTWVINTQQQTQIITLNILDIDLMEKDMLLVRDGSTVKDKLLYKFTSDSKASDVPYIFSTGSSIYITMQTRGYKVGKGFSLTYKQGCDVLLEGTSGHIFSPGYPLSSDVEGSNYPNLVRCTYRINVPSTPILTLRYLSFRTQDEDKVTVIYGTGLTDVLSGTTFLSTTERRTTNGQFNIVFSSDAILTDDGFSFKYSLDCPDPNFNSKTILTGSNPTNQYGSIFVVTCPSGYHFASQEYQDRTVTDRFVSITSVTMRCEYGGVWNHKTTPNCQPKYCGLAPLVDNAYVTSSSGQASSVGGMVTYSCYPGFTMSGSANVACQNDGTWGAKPSCTIASCPPLDRTISFGSGQITEGDGTEFGSIITFTCNPGYQIMGEPILFCKSTSTWTANKPTCERKYCPTPVIKNGMFSDQTLARYGDTRSIVCDSGYRIVGGSATVTCESNEKFANIEALSCEDIDECTVGGFCTQGCTNTMGSFKCHCNPGFELSVDKRTCKDIKECDRPDKGGCSQICTEKDGGYTCSCKSGYQLFTSNGMLNYTIPAGETGTGENDVYRLQHTCVRIQCPDPPALNNGYLLTKRQYHRFEDRIIMDCNIGYKLVNPADGNRECLASGQWSGSNPVCTPAMCPPNSIPGNLKTTPVVSPSVAVNYMDFVNITCNVDGKPSFIKQRQCLLNPETKQYQLYGAQYECGVVDCGVPEDVPGAIIPTGVSTRFGSSFQFTCKNLYTKEGSSSQGDDMVTCKSNGYWGWETLRCVGLTCTDPGRPVDGTQHATTYEEGKLVNYTCDRPGYTLSDSTPLKCVLNTAGTALNWSKNVPTCHDTEPPTFMNTKREVTVPRYTAASVAIGQIPSATDNTGIKYYKISPGWPSATYLVSTETTFTFEVGDFNGNMKQFSTTVKMLDQIPPTISCPDPQVFTLTKETDSVFRSFDQSIGVVASDNSGIAPTITFNPASINMTAAMIGMANYKQWVYAKATDAAGNAKECRFQVMVQAAICSPMSLPTPVHGQKVCTERTVGNGFECKLTCNPNYAFYNEAPITEIVTTCSTGTKFNLVTAVPACSTTLNESPRYTQNMRFEYQAATGTELNENCKTGFIEAVKDILPIVLSKLPNYCLNINPLPRLTFEELTPNDVSINIQTRQVMITYTLIYENSQPSKLASCANLVSSVLSDNNFEETRRLTGEYSPIVPVSCPRIKKDVGVGTETFRDFSCTDGHKLVELGLEKYCLRCPKGTYITGNTCSLCPRGHFSNTEGATSCQECPERTWTYEKGAADISMCKSMCELGTSSDTMLPPCKPCPLNTYGVNSTYCQPCANGAITRDVASTAPDACMSLCQPGTYNSIDGHENCSPCPNNFYQDQVGQRSCKECAVTEITDNVGSTSASNCTSADVLCQNYCQKGSCAYVRHSPSCTCPEGYIGERCENAINACDSSPCYNGGTCTSTDPFVYTCNCPPGTSGTRCEEDLDNCPSPLTPANNPCQNGGMCQDQLNNYNCLCKDGFTGDTCLSVQSVCTSQPCSFGTCNPFGNFRRECSCIAGYEGPNCEININECAENPCLHGGTCNDKVADYECDCRNGYTGKRCEERLNLCTGVTCGGHGQCIEDPLHDTYRCICDPDAAYGQHCEYTLSLNQELVTETFSNKTTSVTLAHCKKLCDNDGVGCMAFSYFSPNMTCLRHGTRAGNLPLQSKMGSSYYVKKCSYRQDDFYTQWFNTADPSKAGNYLTVDYLTTLQLDICGGSGPLDIECRDSTTKEASTNVGTTCTVTNGFVCRNSDQSPGQSCNNHEIRFKCAVSRVFKENTCTIPRFCESSPCVNGNCQTVGTTFVCNCNPGYGGSLCQNNIDDCRTAPCQNGGKCVDAVNDFFCTCDMGWTGKTCTQRIDYCSNGPCDAVGSINCTNMLNGPLCYCKPGYTNPICGQNINECQSNPCLHGGTCNDGIADFSCDCVPGWTGKRCEVLIKPCDPSSPCQNDADCQNLFGNYFCSCKANTYGQNCEFAPSLCNNANPCVHGGCFETNNVPQCSCGTNYMGVGCEIQVNHCMHDTCKNMGTCSVPQLDQYKCTCKPGFEGPNCDVNINNCAGVSCPGNGTCVDGVNEKFCRCPVGYTGADCNQVLDRNYDMLFELPQKTSHAYLPYPIKVTAKQLSVSLWVRFWKSGDTGTFFSMFTVDNGHSLTGKKELMHIDEKGLTLVIGGNRQFFKPYLNYNDGKWYQITVTWNGVTGELRFVVNTIANTINNYEKGGMIDSHVWIVLGAKYNPLTKQPVMYEGFNGWLSQISLYNRILTFDREIPLKLEQPLLFFNNEIFAWNEFQRSSGVSLVIPSTVSSDSCPRGFSGSECKVADERKMVVFPSQCPADQIKLGTSRITKMNWMDPVFEGAPSIVQSTYKSNDVFIWGRYLVVYVATNSAGNKGLCSFKLFVQYTNCTQPENPRHGNAQESRSSYPLITNSIQCDAGYETVRPVPKLFTCSRIGHYDPPKKFNTFKFPPCGQIISNQRREVFAQLFYRVTSTYCDGIRTGMNTEVLNAIKTLNAEWGNGLCGVTSCSDITITVACNEATRKKRQTINDVIVNVTLPQAQVSLTNGVMTLSPYDVLRLAVLSNGKFDFSATIPTAVPLNNLFTVAATLSCPEGQAVVGENCVKCAPGTYYMSSTMTCEACPIGKYQELAGQKSCMSCDGGKTTELTGADSINACKDDCSVGKMFDMKLNLCVDCPIGFYQNMTGQFYCLPCSVEKTTGSTGSTSINDCYVGCGKGEQLGTDGTCVKCPIGKYRDASMQTCVDCVPPLTTSAVGADDISKCDVNDCQAGYYRNASNPKQCLICPSGTYQPLKGQTSCLPCGNGPFYITIVEGATSQDHCRFSCPSGQEQNPASPDTCKGCEIGYFRNQTMTPYATKCFPCGKETSTLSTNSVNPSDCNVLKCPIGMQPNQNNTKCEDCPLGSYQDEPNREKCKTCNADLSTRTTGSTNISQCERYCQGGKEKQPDGSCKLCEIGFYKDNSINKFMPCTRCPDMNTVTANTGADSASKCTVRSCQPGYKRKADDSGCDPCPAGTYQPLPYQTVCLSCQGNTWTRQEATVNNSQCEAFCDEGFEKDDVTTLCTKCPRGFYKSNTPDRFAKCEMCDSAFITASVGSTSKTDCTVANCSAGYKTESDTCILCPVGFYQPEKWQINCTECPTDKTTVGKGSTMESECILSCPPGKEDSSGTCTMCKRGYYKNEEKAAPCTMCPTNTTTAAEGSDNINDCNIVGCPPGYYNVSLNNCAVCEFGKYQPLKWQSVCLDCDSGTTTFNRGSTSSTDCVLDCPKGQQYNAVTTSCEPCPQGYYQDKSDPRFPMCIMCADQDRITPGPGSTSAADCTVRNCTTPGQFINSTTNECQDCSIGQYQDKKWQLSCQTCFTGFTTRTTRSPSSASCLKDCPAGFKQVGDGCVDCGLGFYRDKTTWDCIKCPDQLSTTSVNAASELECNVSPCLAGSYYKRDSKSCQECPTNTYQSQSSQFSCEECPQGKFTTTTGSKSSDDCKGFCDVSNNCSPNARCTEDATTKYKCECLSDYVGDGFNCTHKCDTNYCLSGSTCSRGPPAICQCTEYYKGTQCEIRRPAEQVSDQNTITIVGIVVGILGFILLLILIAACLYRRRSVPDKPAASDYDDRVSLARGPYDYPLAYVPSKTASVVSGPRYMLPQTIEKSYDNQLYFPAEDDPAVYKA